MLNKPWFRLSLALSAIFLVSIACSSLTGSQTALPAATEDIPSTSGGMQIRFTNLVDGGTVQAETVLQDGVERSVVVVQVEVTGLVPVGVSLIANGLEVPGEAANPESSLPFTGEIQWLPLGGGGEYTLVARGGFMDKSAYVEETIHVTVTGLPVYTPTPPPLSPDAAARRITELFQQLYGVYIPAPSIYRFDAPLRPDRSRWIASAYYQGQRYYIELFDDTHYELSTGEYGDASHKLNVGYSVYCRPSGLYRVLVVFVDYGNYGTVSREQALAQVPVTVEWINRLYTDFAQSQGFTSSPLRIEADAAYITPPPSPSNLLTAAQIIATTGIDPSNFDFIIQVDMDVNNTYGNTNFPGLFTDAGGLALQGCGQYELGNVNIWSVMTDPADSNELQGVLVMDFMHEMSHLFGLSDNWPFRQGTITLPDGQPGDDWIPYEMFGWTDTDGDGIPEIIDPTPYGTNGPQP